MIKILKDGTHKRFTQECPICGCIFTYEKEDIKDFSVSTSIDGINISSYTIKDYIECPQCTKRIILAERKTI